MNNLTDYYDNGSWSEIKDSGRFIYAESTILRARVWLSQAASLDAYAAAIVDLDELDAEADPVGYYAATVEAEAARKAYELDFDVADRALRSITHDARFAVATDH